MFGSFAPTLLSNQGHRITLTGNVVIGRRPSVDRAPEPASAQLMTVTSPNEEISRSHCVVSFDTGNVLVWDLGSVNGTLIARGGMIPETLEPRIPANLNHGDRIDLGDGVTLWLG